MYKRISRKENGVSLIEVLVAVALMASIGCVILYSLNTTNRVTRLTNEKTMAESLAQAQLEDIVRADFDDVNQPPVYPEIGYPDPSYTIVINPQHITFDNHTATTTATGLQKITVEIYYDGNLMTTTEAFKGRYD